MSPSRIALRLVQGKVRLNTPANRLHDLEPQDRPHKIGRPHGLPNSWVLLRWKVGSMAFLLHISLQVVLTFLRRVSSLARNFHVAVYVYAIGLHSQTAAVDAAAAAAAA